MTWSVSASGTKEAVKQKIDSQVHESHESIRGALKTLVDDMSGSHVSMTGCGYGLSMSLTMSAWNEAAAATAV